MSDQIKACAGTATDRRSFLKSGAIAAAPLAAVVPGAAMALDDKAERLARIEAERAVEALHRRTLRGLDTRRLADGLVTLAPDAASDPAVTVSQDGCRATARQLCHARFERGLAGDSTVERMSRFQGHGAGLGSEQRTLVAEYEKTGSGWDMTELRLA